MGVRPEHALLDPRSGRWGTLLLSRKLLSLPQDLDPSSQLARAEAWESLERFLRTHSEALLLDPEELGGISHIAAHGGGEVYQIHAPRFHRGIPVLRSYLSAVINHGNLVLLGLRRWGDVEVALEPTVSAARAQAALDPAVVGTLMLAPQLGILPEEHPGIDGPTYRHRLIWQILSDSNWESWVDAHTGEVVHQQHLSRSAVSASVVGGVYPTSNDGVGQEGTEQPGWPIPYARVEDLATGEFHSANLHGNLPACLDGPFRVVGNQVFQFFFGDGCPAVDETLAGPLIDLGSGGAAQDCATPPGHPNGTSRARRTSVYEFTRMRETLRGQVPENAWLKDRRDNFLGTIIFDGFTNGNPSTPEPPFGCFYFQNGFNGNDFIVCDGSTASRANPGQIASVIAHEFGHLVDDNDFAPSLSSPSEGIADAYAALRHNESCIGRGLFGVQCGGYGDPCTDCTGARDIDWAAHTSGVPHDIAFIDAVCSPVAREIGPCGGDAHCEGIVVGEAIWDLYRRDLQSPPYDLLPATALELATRLTYLGGGAVGDWFQCTDGTGTGDGCNADSGYLNFLAMDDDNGDLTDGTPHMGAIFNAFDRHGIACSLPAVQDSGCAGTPTVRPVVQAQPLYRAVELTWGAVPNALGYEVFRTEGVAQCAMGKVKIAETQDTEFVDRDLLNGREYSYVVIPKGPGLSCFGPNSACASATPLDGAHLEVPEDSVTFVMETGDGDRFLDNCETVEVGFEVLSSGLGNLTNVRITGLSSPTHPQIEVLEALPKILAPGLLSCSATTGSLTLRPRGMAHDDTLKLVLELTSDELSPETVEIHIETVDAESDFETRTSHTFSFEGSLEGWDSEEGAFRRVTGPGGDGSSAYIEALPFGRQRCDILASPLLRLSPTSTLSLWNTFDITVPNTFDGYIYDTANIQLNLLDSRGSLPQQVSSGREYYRLQDIGPDNFWICNHYSNGWAGLGDSWASSTFDGAALGAPDLAGEPVQVHVIYGQSRRNQKPGFSFDEVTLTDFDLQVPDTQGNQLCPGPIFVDGFESGDTSQWTIAVP